MSEDYSYAAISVAATATFNLETDHDFVRVELIHYGWWKEKLLRLRCALRYFWANLVSGRHQHFTRMRLENGWLTVKWEQKGN